MVRLENLGILGRKRILAVEIEGAVGPLPNLFNSRRMRLFLSKEQIIGRCCDSSGMADCELRIVDAIPRQIAWFLGVSANTRY